MSSKTIYTCDRCGKEIQSEDHYHIHEYDPTAYCLAYDHRNRYYDLCAECAEDARMHLPILTSGTVLCCPYCYSKGGKAPKPIVDDEMVTATLMPGPGDEAIGQLEVLRYNDETNLQDYTEVYIDIRRCPMCGRRLSER